MTPAEAKAMTATEYVAFLFYMDRDIRERKRQAKARGRKR